MIPLVTSHTPQVEERCRNVLLYCQHPKDSQALLVQGPCSIEVSLVAGLDPEVVERSGDASPVSQFPPESQALQVQGPCSIVVPLVPRKNARPIQCLGEIGSEV